MALLPTSPSHRSKAVQQLFSKNAHWLLAVYALLTSGILILFMNRFSSTDMCNDTATSSDGGATATSTAGVGRVGPASSLLFPVTTSRINVSNPSAFLPFSSSSKINIWDLFVPEQSCSDLSRVGGVGDGGKFVCGLSFLRDMYVPLGQRKNQHRTFASSIVKQPPRPRCVVYSYGVSTDSSFEVGLLEGDRGLPCEVHAFDPTIGRINLPSGYSEHSGGGSITFHKLGLSGSSGTSTAFMLVEHLFDTMHRLNHSFIDVLKIDVEGAEWDILPHLLMSKKDTHLPVFGQLLIELHFQTVPRVYDFFRSLTKHGFVSFSREINLQPCLTGRLPLAVEYSFIHPEAFFDIRSRYLPPPPPLTPAYHTPISAVIYFLTQKKRTHMMAGALVGLYTNFVKQFPQYPVLIFHDDLDEEAKTFMQQAVPFMPLTFVPIVFTIPKNLQPFTLPDRLPCSPHSSTIGYRHMISFHASLIHQYLFDPQNGYQNVEFLLRLDDDSSFSTPIGYDIFLLMRENQLDFGFVNTVQDDEKCVHGLWNHTMKFMQSSHSSKLISAQNKKQFLKWKEGLVIYNNFELSRVSIWKSQLWRNYIESIEKSGGIYLKRWGDAPLHTIFVLLGVPLQRMHAFVDIAYRHDPFVDQTASGLPKPKSNPFALSDKCVYYDQWRCGNTTNSSNTTHLYVSHGPLHPQWSRDILLKTQMQAKLTHNQPLPFTSSSKTIPYQKKIIYTFAHSDRIRVLTATIASIYLNYAKASPCGFIIFHFASFNKSCIEMVREQWRNDAIQANVKFVQVASSLTSYAQYNLSNALPTACGVRDPELFLASRFLIAQAGQALRNMGYEWYFRIADDSKLSQPVTYDIFDRLNAAGKRYGFSKIVLDNEVCLGQLWPAALSHCQQRESHQHGEQCSPLLKQWPTGVVVITNFEVSHFSLWESPVFRHIVLMTEQALHNGNNAVYWSDAAIHTIGMIAHLHQNEVEWLGDVMYSAKMNKKGLTSATPESMPMSKQSSMSLSPSPTNITTLAAPSLPQLNRLFHPQRFGWLGGDVAASCALPSPSQLLESIDSDGDKNRVRGTNGGASGANGKEGAMPSRYVWLFGDSLIGTSTASRRLEAEMVSNSVAIVDINPGETNNSKRIESIHYFWRPGASDGLPTSIFSDADIFNAYKNSISFSIKHNETHFHWNHPDKVKFWPFSALAVSVSTSDLSSTNEMKLIVIGQLVQQADISDSGDESDDNYSGGPTSTSIPAILSNVMGGLSFEEVSSMAVVVQNPHDPPSMWKTSPYVLNFSNKYSGHFRWISMTTLVNKGTFARDQDFIYIFCSYNSNKRSSMFDSFLLLRKSEYHTLLRIPVKAFLDKDFSSLETLYLEEDNKAGVTSSVIWRNVVIVLDNNQKPYAISTQLFTEPHFFFDYARHVFTIVSLEILDSSISVCRSAQAEGPYDCAHTSTMKPPGDNRITYAAKAHPELSGSEGGEEGLVVSYITNTLGGPTDLFEENPAQDLYVPLFLNVRDHPSSSLTSGTDADQEGKVIHRKRKSAGRRSTHNKASRRSRL